MSTEYCHEPGEELTTETKLGAEPDCSSDECHMFMVHRDGRIFRKLKHNWKGNVDDTTYCTDDRLTLIYLPEDADPLSQKSDKSKTETRLEPWENCESMPAFFAGLLDNLCQQCECQRDRVWRNLRRFEQDFDSTFRHYEQKDAKMEEEMTEGEKKEKKKKEEEEKNTEEKKTEDAPQKRCLLKLHSFKTPCTAVQRIAFSMVYHVRFDGKEFMRPKSAKTPNKEHMVAFIQGLESNDVARLLLGLMRRWQDEVIAPVSESSGLTPRLLTAAMLGHYGYMVAKDILNAFDLLHQNDEDLKNAMTTAKCQEETKKSPNTASSDIESLNEGLITINQKLTGIRSTMNFLGTSADLLATGITPFEDFVKSYSGLEEKFTELDSCKEKLRDHDKLMMVSKAMFQYKTNVESIQAHININTTTITNLIAARDRRTQLDILGHLREIYQKAAADTETQNSILENLEAISQKAAVDTKTQNGILGNLETISQKAAGDTETQNSILENPNTISEQAANDGHSMVVIAVLTAFFLPGTFMAVLLTTPMFDWLNSDGKFVVSLPFKIYFGATFPLMIILILFMSFRKWLPMAVESLPNGKLRQRLEKPKLFKDMPKEKKKKETSDSSTPAENGTTNGLGGGDEMKSLSMAEKGMFKEQITVN